MTEEQVDKTKAMAWLGVAVAAIIGAALAINYNRASVGKIDIADNTKININGAQRNEIKEMDR